MRSAGRTNPIDTSRPPAIEPEHFRRLGHELVDLVTDYLAGIRERPVFRPMSPAERGAYGAVAATLPSHRARFAGLERADSVALDSHKWLSVPVECGAVPVRDGRLMREAFSLVPAYLRTERACVLHYATTESDLAALVDVVRETGARLAGAPLAREDEA